MLTQMKVRLIGTSAMLHHNVQQADPLNKYAKEMKKISGKRNKTEEDHKKMAEIEFMAGLYIGEDGDFVVPSEMIEAVLINAAKKEKSGPIAKSSVYCHDDFKFTKYAGPDDLNERLNDKRCYDRRIVSLVKAKIARTRPKFIGWEIEGVVLYDHNHVNKDDLKRWFEVAGSIVGIGDYRPKFGRFEVKFL